MYIVQCCICSDSRLVSITEYAQPTFLFSQEVEGNEVEEKVSMTRVISSSGYLSGDLVLIALLESSEHLMTFFGYW